MKRPFREMQDMSLNLKPVPAAAEMERRLRERFGDRDAG